MIREVTERYSSPVGSSLGFSAVLLLMAVALVGCEEKTAAPAPPPPPPTPEERFERIVSTLEDRLENTSLSGASVVADYNAPLGTPIAQAKVRVDHELKKPASPDEPYRGVICLSTPDSKVTVVLPEPSEEEKAEAAAKKASKRAQLQDEIEGSPELEALVVPTTDDLAGRMNTSPIHEIKATDTKSCFELEYHDGRWVLVTELDEENEPFYAFAIEYAMGKQ